MSGINKAIIVGRLGNDPEMRTMPNGDAVATLSIATSETWNDRNTGERREQTEWHRVVFYRRQAEVCGQYLRKGSLVYVEGAIRTRKWQDQNGQDRYSTEIQGNTMQMLGGRNDNMSNSMGNASNYGSPQQNQGSYNKPQSSSYQAQSRPTAQPVPQAEPPMDNFDDDIPF